MDWACSCDLAGMHAGVAQPRTLSDDCAVALQVGPTWVEQVCSVGKQPALERQANGMQAIFQLEVTVTSHMGDLRCQAFVQQLIELGGIHPYESLRHLAS
jgi:hypothetical protein